MNEGGGGGISAGAVTFVRIMTVSVHRHGRVTQPSRRLSPSRHHSSTLPGGIFYERLEDIEQQYSTLLLSPDTPAAATMDSGVTKLVLFGALGSGKRALMERVSPHSSSSLHLINITRVSLY
jgi:hypothetical protein